MDQPANRVPAADKPSRWKWPRVGWSAVFVGMALGFVVLWVRSYSHADGFAVFASTKTCVLSSVYGRTMLAIDNPSGRETGWKTDSMSLNAANRQQPEESWPPSPFGVGVRRNNRKELILTGRCPHWFLSLL